MKIIEYLMIKANFEKIKLYMENKNLRQKFSISIGSVIFICFALFSLYLLIDQNSINKRTLKENSERYTELLVLSNREHVWNFNYSGLTDTCRAFYMTPEIAEIKIVDNNGTTLINLNDKKVVSRETPIIRDILLNNQKIGELQLVVSRDEYNRKVLSIILKLIGLFVVIFAITLQSVRAVTGRVLKPLNEMLGVVDKISHGDMSKSISVKSNDEIGILAENFNNMMYKVKESIASIQSIIEFMPSIIIQLDTEGRVLEWNRLAEKFAGFAIESARGRHLAEIKPEISVYLLSAKTAIDSGKPFALYRIHLSGYEEMYFNIFVFPLKLEHSESLVLRIDDITELEKKDVQIRQSQKLESIGLLASGVAHDFNNILGGILGTASLLRYKISNKAVDSIEGFSKDLELVEKSCENGAAIVSQLLNLSRKDTDIELHPMDLNDILSQIGKICMNSIDRMVSITVTPYNGFAKAMINSSQIQQTLLNLCINASHAMTIMRKPGEHKGGHLDIGIVKIQSDLYFVNNHPGSSEGEYWRIYVKDTGVGMDNKTLSKIYDPFFTTKTNTAIKGTGLGLSIVYSIVRAHRGFIDVYSEVELGTVFSIYLPVLNEESALSDLAAQGEIVRGNGTILVVDDEEVMRSYTESMLIECGYNVITGTNGEEAVELYKNNSDVISGVILDMVMPVKSGYEAMKDLIKINPDLKIMMTSGLYSKTLIDDVINAGARDFIEKPYSMLQLSQKLNSILKG